MPNVMMTFVSLFLSLTAGVHTVEIAVPVTVARVEILLDGQQIAELSGPPWKAEIDFGRELQPHRLSAVGYNEDGRELHRVHQLINLPRARAECSIMLVDEDHNTTTSAVVHCRDFLGRQPERLRVTFDGVRLSIRDQERVILPTHDPQDFHILAARAFFSGDLEAEAHLIFSGVGGGEVQTQLTAVPVQMKSRKKPKLKNLKGAFTVRGKAVRAVAVEKAPAQVVVVEGLGARRDFFNRQIENTTNGEITSLHFRNDAGVKWSYDKLVRGSVHFPERDGDRATIRFVDPFAVHVSDQPAAMELFPLSQRFNLSHSALKGLMLNIGSWPEGESPRRFTETALIAAEIEFEAFSAERQRLSDALAVAGLHAAARSVPRIVLLVVDRNEADTSLQTAGHVVEYLAHLGVPLVIWTTDHNKKTTTPWGRSKRIRGYTDLRWEAEHLQNTLDRQWIVWIQGAHMLREVKLAHSVKGLSLCRSGE